MKKNDPWHFKDSRAGARTKQTVKGRGLADNERKKWVSLYVGASVRVKVKAIEVDGEEEKIIVERRGGARRASCFRSFPTCWGSCFLQLTARLSALMFACKCLLLHNRICCWRSLQRDMRRDEV